MIDVRRATEADAAAWTCYVEAHAQATAYHLWGWRTVFERAFGHEAWYLVAHEDGRFVGVLPLVAFRNRWFGRFLVSLPFVNYGGLLVDRPEAAEALVDAAVALARQARMSHVELRHRTRRLPDLPVKQHKVAMVLTFEQAADRMWEALDRKVRNQIRKAEKSGLTASVGGAERLEDFYRVFARNMRDLGTPVYPRRFFAETLAQFPERSAIVSVALNGQTIAAGLTLMFRDTVEVPSASSLRDHRPLCPNHLMYWTVIERAIGAGLRKLDFGRSTPDEGTYHFKQQWGAEASPLAWEYCLIGRAGLPDRSPANSRFHTAIEAWRRLPLAFANVLGPQVVRFLP
jgi:FemAB-related protein (PEP-CTERM system-associated)